MTGRWVIPPSVAALGPLARAWLRIKQRFGYAPTDAQIWERDAWVRIQALRCRCIARPAFNEYREAFDPGIGGDRILDPEGEALTYRQNRNAAKARRRALRAAR